MSKPTSDNNKTKTEQAWRNNEEDQSDSCDSDSDSTNSTLSSDSESDSDSDDSDQKLNNSSEENATSSRNENKTVPSVGDKGAVKKTSKQIGIEENFPPIPDLSKIVINEKEEFLHLGQLQAIVGTLGKNQLVIIVHIGYKCFLFQLPSNRSLIFQLLIWTQCCSLVIVKKSHLAQFLMFWDP